MPENVVGRSETTSATSGSPSPSPAPSPALDAKIAAKLKGQNIVVSSKSVGYSISTIEDYSPADLTKIGLILRKFKYPVKNTSESVKTLLLNDPSLAPLVAQSKTAADLINSLAKQYLPGLDSSSGSGGPKAPALPSQQIQQVDPAIKNAIVRSVFQSKLGRDETPQELKDALVGIDKMISAGQVATTSIVGGKTQTTYTPAFSQERAAMNIGSKIESTTKGPIAQDLKEKKSLDFMDFLSQMRS